MAAQFSETERHIRGIMSIGTTVTYNNIKYTITKCDKPSPNKGECKTDVYLELKSPTDELLILKISIKQTNADFLENKINIVRATEIFGVQVNDILTKSIDSIKDKFKCDYLVCFDSYGRTEAGTIKIGWKFELLNKSGGDKSGKMILTDEQKIDIYAGVNLSEDKKNCTVGGVKINNSGVADFILEVDPNDLSNNPQDYIDNLKPIDIYAPLQDIYFACKAVNYRADKDKWDGNRPLSVYVNWSLSNGKLSAELVLNDPLNTCANDIGRNIQSILKSLKICKNNFNNLRNVLHNVKAYKE